MNIQKISSKYNKLCNIIHKSTKTAPFETNHSDTSLQSSNLQSYQTGTTKKIDKNEDCVNCSNLSSIVSVSQGIHIEKKRHNRNTEIDKVFVSKHKLSLKQINSAVNPYKCSEFQKCVTQRDNLQSQQTIYPGKNHYKFSESEKCFTQQSHQRIHKIESFINAVNVTNVLHANSISGCIRAFIEEINLTNVVNVTNALLTKLI